MVNISRSGVGFSSCGLNKSSSTWSLLKITIQLTIIQTLMCLKFKEKNLIYQSWLVAVCYVGVMWKLFCLLRYSDSMYQSFSACSPCSKLNNSYPIKLHLHDFTMITNETGHSCLKVSMTVIQQILCLGAMITRMNLEHLFNGLVLWNTPVLINVSHV